MGARLKFDVWLLRHLRLILVLILGLRLLLRWLVLTLGLVSDW